jgi:hypothetical protein
MSTELDCGVVPCSCGENTIVELNRHRCWWIGSCTTMDIGDAPIEATVTMHLRGDQVGAMVTAMVTIPIVLANDVPTILADYVPI